MSRSHKAIFRVSSEGGRTGHRQEIKPTTMMSAPNHCTPALSYDKWPFPRGDLAGGHFPKAPESTHLGSLRPWWAGVTKGTLLRFQRESRALTSERTAMTASRQGGSHSKLPLFCIWNPNTSDTFTLRNYSFTSQSFLIKALTTDVNWSSQFCNVCVGFLPSAVLPPAQGSQKVCWAGQSGPQRPQAFCLKAFLHSGSELGSQGHSKYKGHFPPLPSGSHCNSKSQLIKHRIANCFGFSYF